jgi:hypothetical protein
MSAYTDLLAKVRSWANQNSTEVVSNTVVADCVQYAVDDACRKLRIPPLEFTRDLIVSESSNSYNQDFSTFQIPSDMIEFIYVAHVDRATGKINAMFDEVSEIRNFLQKGEHYSRYRYAWSGSLLHVHPKLDEGETVRIHYYRRLSHAERYTDPDTPGVGDSSVYAVVAANYDTSRQWDEQITLQLWDEATTPNGFLNIVYDSGGNSIAAFDNNAVGAAAADALADSITGGTVDLVQYQGAPLWNWLIDGNERIILYGAIYHLAGFLDHEGMEKRYSDRFNGLIDDLNREERFRRARGGNVQMNVQTGGLI